MVNISTDVMVDLRRSLSFGLDAIQITTLIWETKFISNQSNGNK